jgi:hypothetical protein
MTIQFNGPGCNELRAAARGLLFWYYMEVICSTAFDKDELPEFIVGGTSGFFCRIAKATYTLFIILLVVEVPFIVAATYREKRAAIGPCFCARRCSVGCSLFQWPS